MGEVWELCACGAIYEHAHAAGRKPQWAEDVTGAVGLITKNALRG